MARSPLLAFTISAILIVSPGGRAVAAQPSERLLPATTKGFISTPDATELRQKFNETQLGAMAIDPVMKPFIDDLRKQIGEKLERDGKKLGIRWDDIEGVCGGEATAALIQPDPKDKRSHASALIIDITGKRKAADELLKKVAANQKANKAIPSVIRDSGIEITAYTQPLKEGQKTEDRSFLFTSGDQLIVTDHEATIRGIVHRLNGNAPDSLASVRAFEETQKRCAEAAKSTRYHVRWFVEPLGYAEANRAAQGGKQKRGKDLLQILHAQGFTAIQGVGGHVFFATENVQLLHRTFVYAPAVKRGPDSKTKDKYDLAMRMLDFPNSSASDALEPQPWALPNVASYLSFHWKMRQAFEYSSTLVDAVGDGKGYFNDIWLGLKTDVNGPQIDVRSGLLDHFGTRVTILSDVKLPVDTKSERVMTLIEVKNAMAVAKTVEKAFVNDPQAKRRNFQGTTIWEIEQGKSPPHPASPAKGSTKAKGNGNSKADGKEEEIGLPSMAVTVYLGHLIVATHVDYILDFIAHQEQHASLGQEPDYQRVRTALVAQGSKIDSIHYFSQTEESYRANFELLKQGKLPVGETMFSRLLNAWLGSGEEGVVRKQEIDGSKLPDFELIKKYLGPGGLFAQSEEDGCWLVGCLLTKK